MDKIGIQLAVEAAGDQSKLAALLGVAPQAVQAWVAQGFAPVGRARQIEMHTKVDRRRVVDPAIADLFDYRAVD
jgi:DNA-binding transcriptional regulator YdaS (Cro superfamily)